MLYMTTGSSSSPFAAIFYSCTKDGNQSTNLHTLLYSDKQISGREGGTDRNVIYRGILKFVSQSQGVYS